MSLNLYGLSCLYCKMGTLPRALQGPWKDPQPHMSGAQPFTFRAQYIVGTWQKVTIIIKKPLRLFSF